MKSIVPNLRLALLGSSFVCLAAFPLAAQQHAVSSEGQLNVRVVPRMQIILPPEVAGSVQKDLAHCVYQRRKSDVVSMLAEGTPFAVSTLNRAAEKRVNEFGLNDCWQSFQLSQVGSLRIKPETFRAMMAEAAYLAKYPSSNDFSAPSVRASDDELLADVVDDRAFVSLSTCIVLADASGADSLLRTVPASDSEGVAANSMASTIKRCVNKNDVSVPVPTIRALVAYGLWSHYSRAGN